MMRPLTCRWRPSLTVSTSGSSGTVSVRHALGQVSTLRGIVARRRRGQVASLARAAVLLPGAEVVVRRADPGADRRPGGLGGLLLGFLLRPTFALAPDLAAD